MNVPEHSTKKMPSAPLTERPRRQRRKRLGSVMTEASVTAARKLRKQGMEYRKIKETLGLRATLANIRHACVGASWEHVSEPPAGVGCCLMVPEKPAPAMDPSVAHMIRPERWDRSKAEIDALPHSLNPPEFNAKRDAIWAFWGI